MDKNKAILALWLLPVVFATTLYTDANLSAMNNSVTTIAAGDCIILMGANFTMVQFCAQANSLINQNVQLTYGQVYLNTPHNLTVTAPSLPLVSQTLSAGQNYTFNSISISCQGTAGTGTTVNLQGGDARFVGTNYVTCIDRARNVSRVLTYNEIYNDQQLGITVTAPAFPAINAVRNMSHGDVISSGQYDNRFNFSFTCPLDDSSICKQNITTTLEYNQNFNNAMCNISVKAPPKQAFTAVDKTLDYGETYTRDDISLKLRAPAACVKGNVDVTLTETTPNYTNTQLNISVKCQQKPAVQFSAAAAQFNGTNISCNATVSIMGTNMTYCPTRLTDLCNLNEKITGDFEGCINRIATFTAATKEQCQNDKIKVDYDLQQCRTGEKSAQDTQEGIIQIVGVFVILIVGGIGALEYLRRKKTEGE